MSYKTKLIDTLLEEACRQWCEFIDEAPERKDGVGFPDFFREICEQKQVEYTEQLFELLEEQHQLHIKGSKDGSQVLISGTDRFQVIPKPLQTLKLYMPLTIKAYERNKWGDLVDEPCFLEGYDALAYEHSILNAIFKERKPEEEERGLMRYYRENDSVNQKVQSYAFTVEEVNGNLMGVAECRVQGELSTEELELLKDAVIGQVADGFGEAFEQHTIETVDCEIYVSLWNSDKSWRIMTQAELEHGQQIGGMKLE